MGALIQLELYTMSKPQKKIMVYVLNMRGEPLMPCSPVKARKLLQAKKAIVKRTEPFTILPVVKIVSLSLWGLTQAIHTLV